MKHRNPYPVDNIMQSNLHSFGMLMKARMFSSEQYRFGFNGKEKTDEVNGDGAVYDYGYRIYEVRLGRFLSVDPISRSYPQLTTYQYSSNSPIQFIDVDGKEGAKPAQFNPTNGTYTTTGTDNTAANAPVIIPNQPVISPSSTVENDKKVWGTMTIVSNIPPGQGGLFNIDGHSWIIFTNVNGETTTLSVWGNTGTQEFWANKEIGAPYVVSRTVTITNSNIDKINTFNNKSANTDWNCTNTCAGYSANLWNTVTEENLDAATPLGTTQPANLSDAIYDANGQKNSNPSPLTPTTNNDNSSSSGSSSANSGTSTPSSSSGSSSYQGSSGGSSGTGSSGSSMQASSGQGPASKGGTKTTVLKKVK